MPCSVSVVVVSRDRPDALYLCVLCLSQVQYNAFEIVVVADAKGLAALDDFKGKIKAVQFDDANISMARNIGIVHSAGEIVAFIDDDAVPEPTWLTYLTAPFSRGRCSAHVYGNDDGTACNRFVAVQTCILCRSRWLEFDSRQPCAQLLLAEFIPYKSANLDE